MFKYVADRKTTEAVAELMPEEVRSGRIRLSVTVVLIFMTDAEAVKAISAALDRAKPDWRKDPKEYLHSPVKKFPSYMRLLQVRTALLNKITEEKP